MLHPCSAPWWKDSVSCSLLLEVRRKKFVFFILAFQRSQVYLPTPPSPCAPQISLKLASASGFQTWGIVMPGGGHGGEMLEAMSQQVSPSSCHGTFQQTFQSALQQPGLSGRRHRENEEKLWLLQWWCAFRGELSGTQQEQARHQQLPPPRTWLSWRFSLSPSVPIICRMASRRAGLCCASCQGGGLTP